MDLELRDKSVVITGASRGIGLACAKGFLAEGAAVTLVSRPSAHFDSAVGRLDEQYPGQVKGISADLSMPASVAVLEPELATADVVVNNAGAIPGGSLEAVDDASWRRAWDLKVYGYLEVCRCCLPSMRERGRGVVINIIGHSGAAPKYDYICGSMANAALMAFTRATGTAATDWGVRVVGINPGATETERMTTVSKARATERFGSEDRWREMLADLPFGRPALVEEIAHLAVFAASPRASYVSGAVIDADAGAMYR